MDEKTLILKFKGNKKELHTQFKVWCAKAGKPMNTVIVDIIEELLKNKSN